MTDATLLRRQILTALETVIDPELGVNIVDLGLVRSLEVTEQSVTLSLIMTTPTCPLGNLIAEEARAAIEPIAGTARKVEISLDRNAHWTPDMAAPEVRLRFAPKSGPTDFLRRTAAMLGWRTE